MSLEITVEGLDEVIAFTEDLPDYIKEEITDALDRAAKEIADYARATARVKTGEYRASIYGYAEGLTIHIGATAEHAQILEFGTRPHDIFPVYKKALRFEIEGETVFATHVRHPGTPAYMTITSAVNFKSDIIPTLVEQAIGEAIIRRDP